MTASLSDLNRELDELRKDLRNHVRECTNERRENKAVLTSIQEQLGGMIRTKDVSAWLRWVALAGLVLIGPHLDPSVALKLIGLVK